eukprot:TRINITY_DN38271_c0_g1_i2.p1 TRINITY_DN38271_c0_g1~~TRINITY_DN38271_c0_g1_i2.p1  ORF type:complete len:595 (+),score=116.50 TRINITY_DN38271_c0_g1_i2:76-1785(+)
MVAASGLTAAAGGPAPRAVEKPQAAGWDWRVSVFGVAAASLVLPGALVEKLSVAIAALLLLPVVVMHVGCAEPRRPWDAVPGDLRRRKQDHGRRRAGASKTVAEGNGGHSHRQWEPKAQAAATSAAATTPSPTTSPVLAPPAASAAASPAAAVASVDGPTATALSTLGEASAARKPEDERPGRADGADAAGGGGDAPRVAVADRPPVLAVNKTFLKPRSRRGLGVTKPAGDGGKRDGEADADAAAGAATSASSATAQALVFTPGALESAECNACGGSSCGGVGDGGRGGCGDAAGGDSCSGTAAGSVGCDYDRDKVAGFNAAMTDGLVSTTAPAFPLQLPTLVSDIDAMEDDLRYYSIDVECVASGARHNDRVVAQVSLVRGDGAVLLDLYVTPSVPVVSYISPLTGLTRELLEERGVPFGDAMKVLQRHLPPAAVLVGQGIENDVRWLGLAEGQDFSSMIDLASLWRVWNSSYGSWSIFSQEHLWKVLFAEDPAGRAHNAVDDAVKAVRLFRLYRRLASLGDAAVEEAKQRLLSTPVSPPFKKRNPIFEGVCMGDRKNCRCGAPMYQF